MRTETIYIVSLFIVFGLFESRRRGFWKKAGEKPRDAWIEVLGSVALLVITQPLVLFISYQLASVVMPNAAGAWSTWALPLQIIAFLVLDDMSQYWWHRLSHSFEPLYRLHRAHHDVDYLSIRVVYRNNLWYYLFMPSLWFSGMLIYLGLGELYAFYISIKLTVIVGAHSDVHWDENCTKLKRFIR